MTTLDTTAEVTKLWGGIEGGLSAEQIADKCLVINPRVVYGSQKNYPFNDTAKLFARLTGAKTLSIHTLAIAIALGYRIEEVY